MEHSDTYRWQDSADDLVAGVALPLKNLEFLIDDYLMANGCRLDVETRVLLAGVRDCLGRVVCSANRIDAPGGHGQRELADTVGVAP